MLTYLKHQLLRHLKRSDYFYYNKQQNLNNLKILTLGRIIQVQLYKLVIGINN